MSEEKIMILKMLKEGKITEEEALKLLSAVGEGEGKTEKAKDFNLVENTQNLADKIVKGVDKILKMTGEKLNNIELGYDFDIDLGDSYKYSFSKFKSKIEKTLVHELANTEGIELEVRNNDGSIDLHVWDEPRVEVLAHVNYNEQYVDKEYDFIEIVQEGKVVKIKTADYKLRRQPFNVKLDISVPRGMFEGTNIKSKNGSIKITGLNSKHVVAKTFNGRLNASDMNTENASLSSTSGGVSVKNSSGNILEMETVNGKLSVQNARFMRISANTVNGSIKTDELSEVVRFLEVSTVNGSVNIMVDDMNRPIRFETTKSLRISSKVVLPDGFTKVFNENGKVEATTSNYDDSREDKLEILASTVNGSISVE